MAWLAVEKSGMEIVTEHEPFRDNGCWVFDEDRWIELPSGSIQKLIGRTITWEEGPVEFK